MLKWIEEPEAPVGTPSAYYPASQVVSSSGKAIIAFSFGLPDEEISIRAEPGQDGSIPIKAILPPGTDLRDLSPSITYIGSSITPPGGASQSANPYTDSARNFTNPQVYTVRAVDGSEQSYTVQVYVTGMAPAAIVWFDLELPGSPGRPAEGLVYQPATPDGTGAIIVHVPSGTDLTNLRGAVAQTGASVSDNQSHEGTGTMALLRSNFSGPVSYTVRAEDDSTQVYVVTVIVDKSRAKEITKFSFAISGEVVMIGPDPRTDGQIPIMVMVPVSTSLSSLTPTITYRGASMSGKGILDTRPANFDSPHLVAGSSLQDFSGSQTTPEIYTVTAEDGSTQDYAVSVYRGSLNTPADDNAKAITGFYFTSPSATGIIDERGKTIDVTVPNGTSLSSLSPTVYYTGASLDPSSGRAVNFSSPVIYTVTARNGTAQPYTVRVRPRPASTKEITAVSFPGAGVLESVIGAIPDADGYLPISVTVSEQTDINALRPTISHTGISITPPGGTPQTTGTLSDSPRHFGSPQTYRVRAEDGSYNDYTISVHVSGGGSKIITGFVFQSIPAVGQINQETYTIEVKVPHSATITSLAPTITYLGKSIGYAGTASGETPSAADTNTATAGQRGNTYTDAPRGFSNSATTPLIYTVTAADPPPNNTREYTVTVTRIPEIAISYEGLRDDKFTTDNFDPTTGLFTVQITAGAGYSEPYEWYVDGVKQSLSATQNTLVIKTADFGPGRHQVTVLAKKIADSKHYTNVLYVTVQG
jgi:hypothetical protein